MTAAELYRQEVAKRQPVVEPPPPRPARPPHRRFSALPFRCGHDRVAQNTYTNKRTGVTACLQCRRHRSSRRWVTQ